MLKSRKLILIDWLTTTALLTAAMTFWDVLGTVWTPWDYQILDAVSRIAFTHPHGLLDEHFARLWSLKDAFGLLVLMSIVLALSAMLKKSWMLHFAGTTLACSLLIYAQMEFTRYSLFPAVSLGSSFLFMFWGLLVVRHIALAKEQSFIRQLFAKRAPERLVAQLLAAPERLQLDGEEKNLTILFAGLNGLAALTEHVPPRVLMRLLQDYFTEMADIVMTEGGLVDKFLGGRLMAEFGVFVPGANHAEIAVRAALKMQRRMLDLRQQWERQGLPSLQCHIGIGTGNVLIGNMGAREIIDYTVLGESVHVTSRLERLNKDYGTSLLVSEATYAQLSPQEFRMRLLDKVRKRDNAPAIKIYEVHGDLATFRSTRPAAYYQAYQQAFEAYLHRDLSLAEQKCRVASVHAPNDCATALLLNRIHALASSGIPEDWDGAVTLAAD